MKIPHISLLVISTFIITILSCERSIKTEQVNTANQVSNQLTKWPQPKPHEIEVMVLGVYHMSNPHLDENNINSDDVRTEKRQKELQDLAEKLVQFKPDIIVTEANYKSQYILDSLYLNVPTDTIFANHRHEAIQIGCRLGKMLNLPKIHAIDFPMRLGNDSLKVLYKKYNKKIPHKLIYPKLNWERINKRSDSLLYNSTITEFLIETNKEENHLRNHYGMFADLRIGEGDNFGGARNLGRWYERNFKMVHNIYRAATPETKRMLLIVGSGHVSPIRHILDDAPMFCPVSPMPYLKSNL